MRDTIQAKRDARSSMMTGTIARPNETFMQYMGRCARCGLERNIKMAKGDLCRSCLNQENVEPIDSIDQTPCYFNPAFYALDDEVTERLEPLTRPMLDDRARSGVAAEYQERIAGFCGDCPVRDACARWAGDEGWTGVAGGDVFFGGISVRPIEPVHVAPGAILCRNGLHELTPENLSNDKDHLCRGCARARWTRNRARRRERRNREQE